MALTAFEKFYYLGLAVAAAGIAYWLYLQVIKFITHQRIDQMLGKHVPAIPGAVPFLGHLLQLNHGRPWETICIDFPKKAKAAVCRFNMFRSRVLLITTPPMVQRVLQTRQRIYHKDMNSFSEFLCLLGTGLVTSEGQKWRHGRQLLSAAMRIEILEELPQIAIECTSAMLNQMMAYAKRGEPFDLLRGFQRLTLQVIGRALLSLDAEECDNVFSKLYLPIVDECNARVWAPWKGFMFWSEGFKAHSESLGKLNEYFVNLIENRWARRQSGERRPEAGVKQDILDLYMHELEKVKEKETGEKFAGGNLKLSSSQVIQLRDDLKTMVLAGHETTAAMLTWTTYELLKDTKIADKVRTEHKRALGDYDVKNRGEFPPLSAKEDLLFTRSCLREALRRYSVVPIIMREAAEDDFVRQDESGLDFDLTIPKGTAICVGITSVHRDPTLWPDPMSYKPERFVDLDKDMESVQYSFIPFSAGPRHCLGQHVSLTEAQFIISYLFANADMELASNASGEPHKYVVPTVPENGLPVKVERATVLLKD